MQRGSKRHPSDCRRCVERSDVILQKMMKIKKNRKMVVGEEKNG
jgi:hypothetical protein